MSDEPTGVEPWVSISVVGDAWEVQVNPNTREYRHRRLAPPWQLGRVDEWSPGRPPTGVHGPN